MVFVRNLVIVPEANTRYDSNIIKKLTGKFFFVHHFIFCVGTDVISFRLLFRNEYKQFVNTAKMILSTNRIPQFSEVDYALIRRVNVIEFPYTFDTMSSVSRGFDLGDYKKNNEFLSCLFYKMVDSDLSRLAESPRYFFWFFDLLYLYFN